MVRALMREENPKTQTRRMVKNPERLQGMLHGEEGAWCPYGGVGDRLWVRENWRAWERLEDMVDGILYQADGAFRPIESTTAAADLWITANNNGKHGNAWRPSIHMARWASRLTLEVTGVRVERLQDITEADAIAEGIERINDLPVNPQDFTACWKDYTGSTPYWNSPIDSYHSLWDSINADRAPWASNPWVWVVEFRRVA